MTIPVSWLNIDYKSAIEKISTNKIKIKQSEYLNQGKYPIIDQGQNYIGGYTNDNKKIINCNFPIIVFGDHTKVVKLIDFKFAPGADGVKIVRPLSIFNPKIFFYFTKYLVKKIPDKGYSRHFQYIEKEKIPLPPINEQNRIVEKIEKLFSDLDKATEDLKKTQEQLKIYRQAVLKAAFEGKLTEKWREQNNIELSFEEVSLVDIADVILGQSPPSSTYNTNRVGLPFYQGKKEFGDLYPTPEKYCSEPKKIAESNDILISVRAPVGPTNFCKEKSCIGRGLAAIRSKEKVKKYYLFYYLNYFVFNLIEKSTGTTFNAISKDTLERFKVSLFSLLEQQQIIKEIESRLSICDKLEEIIKQSLNKMEYLRQSILKKAFDGKLVKQDPNDEPAENLLKKIKQEKEKFESTSKKRKKI